MIRLLLCLCAGCSWISMEAPGPGSPIDGRPPACTSSRVAPALDALAALPGGATAGLIAWAAAGGDLDLFAEDDDEDESAADTVGLVAGLIAGGILVGSAITGFSTAARCRRAVADYQGGGPRPGAPPPGSERGVCRRDRRCDPGLSCASGYCVRL